ncbi:hypothetical protein F7731_11710 [Cytobacillus depressus]|uniref:Uncharacterized protein n=1 Tax=Cytobacillus depressus TaxID=1602942 RepID=A0A6L3V4X2_9BACI|nr:hypothetical protein [Cytobacillus depressus]KAB2336159.1 hypothetical protein F7731_11710 [Cytobacillus depressus]
MKRNSEEEIRKLHKAQRVALYWLLGLIYSAFIGLQLGRVQAIADFNYSLHEIMYVPLNIAMFIVPVLLPIYLYFSIKYLRKRGRVKGNFKATIKAAVVIISVIIIVSIVNHQFHELSTGGVFKLEEKLQEKGKYYLIFDDKKIKVSMNEYKLVKVNEKYLVNFIWNSKTPNKGSLETIEPIY